MKRIQSLLASLAIPYTRPGARLLLAVMLALSCQSPAQAQMTLGDVLGNVFGGSIKKAIDKAAAPKASAASSAPVATNDAASAATVSANSKFDADGSYFIPAFDGSQARHRQLLLYGERMDYVAYSGSPGSAGGLVAQSQLVQEYLSRLNETNHRNSFEERDFVAFAQPYVNWAENYLMKPEIFVSMTEVSAELRPFDVQANAFHVVFTIPDPRLPTQRLAVRASFGDQGNRDLEQIRSTNGISTVVYVTQPYDGRSSDARALAVQLFSTRTGQSLAIIALSETTQEQMATIRAHALTSLQLASRTPIRPGTSAASLAEGQRARRKAAANATVQAANSAEIKQTSELTGKRTASGAGPSTKTCPEGEDAYQATKLSKAVGAIRVDYIKLATRERNWTNMGPDDISSMGVKVGAVFCMAP